MFAATGSTAMTAICPGYFRNSASTESRSLYFAVSVAFARSAGTPGEPGMPSVATPEPAATRNESAWPW